MLMRGLKDADRALYLEEQIKALREQVKELQVKTGQRVKTTEYVNIPVIRLEKERIRDLAHNARLSNGRYLRACLEGTKSIPELEGEIKRLNRVWTGWVSNPLLFGFQPNMRLYTTGPQGLFYNGVLKCWVSAEVQTLHYPFF